MSVTPHPAARRSPLCPRSIGPCRLRAAGAWGGPIEAFRHRAHGALSAPRPPMARHGEARHDRTPPVTGGASPRGEADTQRGARSDKVGAGGIPHGLGAHGCQGPLPLHRGAAVVERGPAAHDRLYHGTSGAGVIPGPGLSVCWLNADGRARHAGDASSHPPARFSHDFNILSKNFTDGAGRWR